MGRTSLNPEERAIRGDSRKQGKEKFKTSIGEATKTGASLFPVSGDVFKLIKPDWLSPDAEVIWDSLVPMALAQKMVCALDSRMVGKYCQLIANAENCERVMLEHGLFIKNRNRTFTPRPEVKMATECWKQVAELGSALGLTPKARKQMNIVIKQVQSGPVDAITARKNGIMDL